MNLIDKIKLLFKNAYNDSLHRNSFYMLANSIIGNILGFIFSIIIARYYATTEVGLATAIISVSAIITSVSNLGFVTGIIMFLPNAKEEAAKLINSVTTLVTFITVLISVIYLLNIRIFSKSITFIIDSQLYSFIFILATVVSVLVVIQDSICIALRKSEYLVLKNLVFGTRLIFPFFLIPFGSFGIFTSYCIANLFALLIGNYYFLPHTIKDYIPKIYISKKLIKRIIKYSLGNNVANIFQMIPGLILPIIITDVLNPSSTAFFYVAWTLTNILYFIPKSITTPLFAEISHNRDNFNSEIKKAIKSIIILVLPSTIIFMIISNKLLFFYGEEYVNNSSQLLIILIISVIPISINEMYYTIWRIENKIYHIILATGLITIITVSGGYLLATRYGIGLVGFGISWMISNILISIFSMINIVSRTRHRISKKV